MIVGGCRVAHQIDSREVRAQAGGGINPLKRRIGMRCSNEFYFVMPAEMLRLDEVPAECKLIEAGEATFEEWKRLIQRQNGSFHYNPERQTYCMITVPAPWRDTPGRPGNWWHPCCAINPEKGRSGRPAIPSRSA